MTPDVVVDIGNSRMKWGLCREGRVCRMAALPHGRPEAWEAKLARWALPRPLRWAAAGVHPGHLDRFQEWAERRGDAVNHIRSWEQLELPLAVDEPGRVGIDRLLTALAARRRAPHGAPVITINVGTAVTIDCVKAAGVFLGGVIFPGPRLMARALRRHTAKLPLIRPEPQRKTAYRGANTEEAIQVGIQLAIVGAAEEAVRGFASDCQQPVAVFITGGGLHYFANRPFLADTQMVISDPRLTLEGIRIAAEAMP